MLRKPIFLLLATLFFVSIHAQQQAAAIDSVKRALSKATTIEGKVYWMDMLSRILVNVNMAEADKYGQQLIEIAEESRDRRMMVEAYMSNGLRCSYFAGSKDNTTRSIEYYSKALDIARQNKMDDAVGKAMLRLAGITLTIPDKDKALNYANQGFSIIATLNDDSLKAASYNTFGDIYLSRNDKILSLRNYLTAARLAEDIKNDPLIRQCSINLAGFYSNIGEYDKAIDYYTKALKKLDEIKEKNAPYQRAIDINSIGNLYAQKKNYDLAISYFNRSLAVADSLKFPTLKIPAYVSLLNQYLRMDKPAEALSYFNSAAGKNLQEFLKNFGFAGVIDQSYGVIYTELGQLDSAAMHFNRAAPYFENVPNETSRMGFYAQYANFFKKKGDYDTAIALYHKVKDIADKTGQLESIQGAARQLDSLYIIKKDFQRASEYGSIYYKYKDSLEKLNKEKELTQVEAADEQMRIQRIEKEKIEAKRKRFNIQYLGITIGITALFVALVMLGMFRVSATTIKMIGFFTFLMFFEFIFLIFKKNIYSITEGEPWKDLLFMIGLAAILLPFHHWLEHKVIHYLTSHNRLTEFRSRLFNRKKTNDH